MSAALKPWFVLVAIFIAGGLSGGALTMAVSSHFMHPPGPAQMNRHIIERLTRGLALTPDQQVKIEPIVNDATDKIEKLHHDEFKQISQILQSTDDQIAQILTPEQKIQLKKMEEDRQKEFSGRMRMWGPSHSGPNGSHFHGGRDGDPDDRPPPPEPPAPGA